ncbi:uncharacterized protein PHALS_04943 [Plasmopara halstedii]|uniref:Uncharacterized protein n=1 Tax=Plasmopara halstedii TaxID=4781 RepID=A0A0P1AB04_PLAHL|nr:uncharacterized protein PHALS_04943 [Plasmopara halstedii]CEG37345.1 hypothetical protein PHALS_04943 [Plasmopara halstedii]|eukprot:XP_024573714.1 hypothetical protein PHALS_04943 [Plasmopara halstedii]
MPVLRAESGSIIPISLKIELPTLNGKFEACSAARPYLLIWSGRSLAVSESRRETIETLEIILGCGNTLTLFHILDVRSTWT